MSTIYMSQLSTLPLMEGDQDQGHFPAFHLAKDPPMLFPFMIDNPVERCQVQGGYGEQHLGHQFLGESTTQQFNDHMMMAGGSDVFGTPSPFRPTIRSVGSDMIQRSSYDPYDIETKCTVNGSTTKWASASATPPAKMQIMRKAVINNPDGGAVRKPRRRAQAHQADANHHHQQQQHAMGVIRVCSDCNTTKTPLWRSGPCGPKSLCNACGIRQRKARRTMAAAAGAAAATATATATPANGRAVASGTPLSDVAQAVKPVKKEKRAPADVDRSLPFKKRCKNMVDDHAEAAAAPVVTAASETGAGIAAGIAAGQKKDHDHFVDDDDSGSKDIAGAVPERLSKTGPPAAALFHGFPRDEITDAAMLLMTLSCGLVSS